MAVSLRATPALVFTSGATLTLPIAGSPATTGDLAVMFVSASGTITLPTGWTQLWAQTANVQQLVAYRVLQAGDPGANVAVTVSAGATEGCIVVLTGTSITPGGVTGTTVATGSTALTIPVGLPIGMALYFGAVRTTNVTVSLSSGTADSTRSADASIGAVVGHESISAAVGSQLTITANTGTGQMCVLALVVTEAGANAAAVIDPTARIAGASLSTPAGHVYKGRLAKTLDTVGAA